MKNKNIIHDLAIVIPAFNEEMTIVKTLTDFVEYKEKAYFVIVDNNSSDKTRSLAEKALEDLSLCGVVLREERQGKGFAIRKAFSEIDALSYVMVDADLTYSSSDLKKMLDVQVKFGADMVVGDRHQQGDYEKENKRLFHNFGNKFINYLINRLFGCKLNDVMSGYRLLSKRFVKNYPILVSGFELETDMTLHALDKRFLVREVPVSYRDRPQGSFSKLSTISDGLRVFFTIFQILRLYKPLMFFGFFFIFFLLSGILAGAPAIYDWVRYDYVYHVPLAILAVGLEIFALLSLGIGLVLDVIKQQNARAFELGLLRWEE